MDDEEIHGQGDEEEGTVWLLVEPSGKLRLVFSVFFVLLCQVPWGS